jgi:type I restriction enzyme S subunit
MAIIGDVFKVTTGSTPSRGNPLFWGGDIKWVSSGEVAFCRITDTVEKITELGLANSSAKVYPPNTVLIAMIGQGKTRGQVAILDCYSATNQNVSGIHVYDTIHIPEYVYWWLRSRYYESRLTETGTAQPALSGERVKQMLIPLPTSDEQHRIVKYLDCIQARVDVLKRLQSETSAELDALLPSVLDKAFKGEL